MTETMSEMTRAFLEAESLRMAKSCLGCGDLTAVKIERLDPPGSGPNWRPSAFEPALPPLAEQEARQAIAALTGKYALAKE
jgi:hypothetical protein